MICKICHVNQVDTTEGRCRFCFNEQEKIINRTDLPYSYRYNILLILNLFSRTLGGETASRLAHNEETAGSTPA